MLKNTIIGVLAVAVLGILLTGFLAHTEEPKSEATLGGQGSTNNAPNVSDVAYYGVKTSYGQIAPLKTATTTICAIQSPTTGTSTLQLMNLQLDTSSTSASTITIAKANNAFATTTIIGSQYAVAASAQAFVQASTSPTAGGATVFAPGQWLVVGMSGGTGTFSPTGSCIAEWQSSVNRNP